MAIRARFSLQQCMASMEVMDPKTDPGMHFNALQTAQQRVDCGECPHCRPPGGASRVRVLTARRRRRPARPGLPRGRGLHHRPGRVPAAALSLQAPLGNDGVRVRVRARGGPAHAAFRRAAHSGGLGAGGPARRRGGERARRRWRTSGAAGPRDRGVGARVRHLCPLDRRAAELRLDATHRRHRRHLRRGGFLPLCGRPRPVRRAGRPSHGRDAEGRGGTAGGGGGGQRGAPSPGHAQPVPRGHQRCRGRA